MEIEHHRTQIQKTAHYYTYGNMGSNTKNIFFVCHGYAQRANEFLESFTFLDPDRNFVIAPEGLSKFYQRGFYGDVVASWMTKDDRLDEIQDYVRFIHKLYEKYNEFASNDVRIILVGFSQGASTIMRWITAKFPFYHVFINWAGWIPEDIEYTESSDYLSAKKNYFVYGMEDPFLPSEKIQELSSFCKSNKLNFKFYLFEGAHEINQLFLDRLLKKSVQLKLKSI